MTYKYLLRADLMAVPSESTKLRSDPTPATADSRVVVATTVRRDRLTVEVVPVVRPYSFYPTWSFN